MDRHIASYKSPPIASDEDKAVTFPSATCQVFLLASRRFAYIPVIYLSWIVALRIILAELDHRYNLFSAAHKTVPAFSLAADLDPDSDTVNTWTLPETRSAALYVSFPVAGRCVVSPTHANCIETSLLPGNDDLRKHVRVAARSYPESSGRWLSRNILGPTSKHSTRSLYTTQV